MAKAVVRATIKAEDAVTGTTETVEGSAPCLGSGKTVVGPWGLEPQTKGL
jgi:hypothetical protein